MVGDNQQLLLHAGQAEFDRVVGVADVLDPSVDCDLTLVRGDRAGEDLDQGALAGSVGADQAEDLTAADRDVDVVEDLDGSVLFRDSARLQ